METTADTIVIASLDPPTLWNFYSTMKEALADLDHASCSTLPNAESFSIMRYGDYKAAHFAFWDSRRIRD